MKNETWEILGTTKKITFKKLLESINEKLPCKKETLKQYLNALKIAKYISLNTEAIQDKTVLKLLKKTGTNYPTFSNGILIDNNTKEEFSIHKHKKSKFKSALIIYLEAIIKINEMDIVSSDLNKKFAELWGTEIEENANATVRKHRETLVKKGLIVVTENFERNSPILTINLKGIKELYEEIKDKKIYGKEI